MDRLGPIVPVMGLAELRSRGRLIPALFVSARPFAASWIGRVGDAVHVEIPLLAVLLSSTGRRKGSQGPAARRAPLIHIQEMSKTPFFFRDYAKVSNNLAAIDAADKTSWPS